MTSTPQLADLLMHVADTLVGDFDLVELLHDLTVSAAALGGARSAGLVLVDPRGGQDLMASSDALAAELERRQLHHQEGPGIDCLREGRAATDVDLRLQRDRWPSFAPEALERDVTTAHAFPLRLRDTAIGVVDLFSTTTQPITPRAARVVQSLADVATVSIIQERAAQRAEALAEHLQSAISGRTVVEQARGAVAELAGVDVDASFEILRRRSRLTRTKLVDVAREVLAGSYDHIPRAEKR